MQVIKSISYLLLQPYVRTLLTSRSFVAILFIACHLISAAQNPPSREYQLKAVFLFNFTQFIDWPAHSFSSEQEPMIIGILGKDPFGSYLQETISGEKANNHPLEIRHYNSMEEVGECQVLFVNLPDLKKNAAALATLKERNILTVSDAPDFLRLGGMIRFYTRQDKIKIEVNLEATKTANLSISSKLLRLVEIFEPQNNR